MVSKKYVGDYRLENVLDEKGRLRTVPVYRGPLFRFKADEERLKRGKRRSALLLAAATAALLLTLLLRSDILSGLWVAMPLALSLLPAVLLWMGAYERFTAGAKLPRDKCDRIHHRFAAWSIVLAALSALSLMGQVAAYLGGADWTGLPVTACTAAVTGCAIFLFLGRKDLELEEIPANEQPSFADRR